MFIAGEEIPKKKSYHRNLLSFQTRNKAKDPKLFQILVFLPSSEITYETRFNQEKSSTLHLTFLLAKNFATPGLELERETLERAPLC